MRPYSLGHLTDAALLRDLKDLVARDRATTAALLAHIAEVDARRLYAAAGYSSMFAYCVEELGLSEAATYKRITVGRAARQHPALFGLLAQGRLHLTAARLLAPHLTSQNGAELLAAAVGRRAAEIESMLVARFGRPDEPVRIRPIAHPVPATQATPEQCFAADPSTASQLVSRPVGTIEAGLERAGAPPESTPAPRSATPAPAPLPRYRLEVTIDQATHDKLRRLQALLGHSIPSGDVAQVLDRALDALLVRVEKQKLAATTRPRVGVRPPQGAAECPRRVPAAVRRAVWARDEGRCTFVAGNGRRCGSRWFIEIDHAEPAARGGRATFENLRLRCRMHNQLEAERMFGRKFMARKRALRTAAASRGHAPLVRDAAAPT